MPICRRKRVLLSEPSQALLNSSNGDRQVFYLSQTGEIFETYEEYAARMSFYRLKQFQCEVTGKSNLDYFQAMDSEAQEARTMHSRFPEQMKASVLCAIQWQIMGRLDHLVEAVYERFKDRYFPDERVLVQIENDKFLSRVISVTPPDASQAHASSSKKPLRPNRGFHYVVGDLKLSVKDAGLDDPQQYLYRIQVIEEQQGPDARSDKKLSAKDRDARESLRQKWTGSLLDVHCDSLSRDRLAFSRSILRRFVRDCVDRAAAVASPWTVKPSIAEKYGVVVEMPEEVRKSLEASKRTENDKRKKVCEEKEGPAAKKKKMSNGHTEQISAAEAKRREKAAKAKEKEREKEKAKEEAERLAAEKEKKKPIRYPIEDLDVRLTDRNIKAGAKVMKPKPEISTLPFGEHFQDFLMVYNFLSVYGQTLHLSSFTMDEFQHALCHGEADLPCQLISEIHSVLIYNLRTVSFTRHSAVLSLFHRSNKEWDVHPVLRLQDSALADALAEVGNSWERMPLRHAEGRAGWEEALVGCLKDHSNVANFPRLRSIFTGLLFAWDERDEDGTVIETEDGLGKYTQCPPADRYTHLDVPDKIEILAFMCNLAVSSKAIHTYMENCEESLTALRKEKIDVNRSKKQHLEDMSVLLGEATEDVYSAEAVPASPQGSDLSESPSDSVDATGRRKSANGHAKQREAARAKMASAKQALAERRRLDEEVNKLERRLEAIEREFRKLFGSVRVKPLGKDRFYNQIWWFDGLGSSSLLGQGGSVQYGTGRIFVQAPNDFDTEVLERRDDIEERLRDEDPHEQAPWASYDTIEEVEEYFNWLNPKGIRELALRNAFTKWWSHIAPGMRKRAADLEAQAKIPDARRSARKNGGARDVSRDPYMLWTNRRAASA